MKRWMLAAVVVLILAAGCGQEIEPGRTETEAPRVEGLGLLVVEGAPLSRSESFPGTVESPDRGVLKARIDGRVVELPVAEGDRVDRGQLLLVLGDHQAGDRLDEARAGVAAAQSSLAAARSAAELAEKTRDRYARLAASRAVTPQEMDEIEERLRQAEEQVAAAEAGLARAKSSAGTARRALDWTRVTAPYPARVVRTEVEVGSTVMPGTPVLVLDRDGAWEVRAAVPESRLGSLQVGQALQVEIPSRELRLEGRLQEIVPAADPQSRAVDIKVGLDRSAGLVAGLFARVEAPGRTEPVLLLPTSALVERGQLHGIYVVVAGRLQFRLVRTGRQLEEQVEILAGLEAGETVVVEGVERARNGARVGS